MLREKPLCRFAASPPRERKTCGVLADFTKVLRISPLLGGVPEGRGGAVKANMNSDIIY
jgi:hypothetical protein